MKQKVESAFVISEFANPSGDVVYRVSGWLHGKRIRKNFPTHAEARAEVDALELAVAQDESGLRRVITRLSEAQVAAAEAAFLRLGDAPQTLAFCVDYTLTNYRPPQREKLLAEAVAEYLSAKTREAERGIISIVQVASIRKELKLLSAYFPKSTVSPLSTARLAEFCARGMPSLKTYNNRRGILSTFFKFAFQQDRVASNPVEKMPYHRIAHRRGSAKTLSVERCRDLMSYVERYEGGQLVPFFALCLFAGIRPCVRAGEIIKLKPSDVRLDTGVIHIEPEVSKVRMKRRVASRRLAPRLSAGALSDRRAQPPARAFGHREDLRPLPRHHAPHVHFDARGQVSLDGRGRAPGGQFRKHHSETLPRPENSGGGRAVLLDSADGCARCLT